MSKNVVLFLRYFISYVIVFLIPVLIIGFLSYSHFLSIIETNFNQSSQNALASIKDQVNSRVDDIFNISTELSSYEFKPSRIQTFDGLFYSSQKMNFKRTNEFFYDIYYYIRDGEFFYTSNGTYRSFLFYKEHFHYNNMDEASFMEQINSLNQMIVRGAETISINGMQDKKMVSFIVPIPLNSQKPYGTAVFLVDEKKMNSLFKSILEYPESDIVVYNEQGEMILSTIDTASHLNTELWNAVVEGSVESSRQIELQNEQYLMSSIQSAQTGWHFAAITPRTNLLAPVKELQEKALISMLIVILIGMLLIYLMMHYNYHPVKKLFKTSERFAKRYNIAHSGFEQVALTLQKMGSQINDNKDALLQHAMYQLIKGYGKDCGEALQKMKELGFEMNHFPYYVAIVELEERPSEWPKAHIFSEMKHHLSAYCESFRLDMTDQEKSVWILSQARCQNKSEEHIWKNMVKEINAAFRINMTVGIGKGVYHNDEFYKSYMEAHTALQHKWIKGTNRLIDFRDIEREQPQIHWQPFVPVETLKLVIQENEPEKLQLLAEKMSKRIRKESGNLFVAKCIVIEIIHMLAREMRSVDPQYTVTIPDVLTLSNYHQMTDLTKVMEETIKDAAKHMSKVLQFDNKKLKQIMDYLEQHMYHADFSIQGLADEFACSRQHINAYFKEHKGMTIQDFIIQERMVKSKQLLSQSNMPIYDIVSEVGYLNNSSFTRKFKEFTGCTPGEYRKLSHNAH